jgi:dihydroorotate dehydrogenase (fumarate)
MKLTTHYLGLELSSPLLPGASPLVDDLDMVRRLEDAGAPAIVMHSLFEEQLTRERERTSYDLEAYADTFAEASSLLPRGSEFRLAPDAYLEQLRRIKAAVGVPVIASLNGVTATGWLEHARLIEEAGASALELNVYQVATDPGVSGPTVEQRVLELISAVRKRVHIPLAVKLGPFHSSLAHFASEIVSAGAHGLVLFNRFYQPDIDVDALDVIPRLALSDSSELLLRLRWLAILSGHLHADLSASGGVHTPVDAVKALMAGAVTVQTVSSLLRHGPEHLAVLRAGLERWLTEHEYSSLDQLRGSMNLARCPDPAAFERGNYLRILNSWKPE